LRVPAVAIPSRGWENWEGFGRKRTFFHWFVWGSQEAGVEALGARIWVAIDVGTNSDKWGGNPLDSLLVIIRKTNQIDRRRITVRTARRE